MDQAKIDHFWSHVEKTDSCWLWQKQANVRGYGVVRVDRIAWLVHRLSWMLAHGPIPEGLWVLHHCDVPRCVNPDHLFLGTHADNMADMITKGRQVGVRQRGEAHHSAKLTREQVLEIRERHTKGETGAAIARDYPVNPEQINLILRRKNWTHI